MWGYLHKDRRYQGEECRTKLSLNYKMLGLGALNIEKDKFGTNGRLLSHRVKIKNNRWHTLGPASEVQGHSQVDIKERQELLGNS